MYITSPALTVITCGVKPNPADPEDIKKKKTK